MLQNKLIEGEELAIAVAKQAYENKAKKIKVLDLIVFLQLLIFS